jgi:hypothetical protein
LPDNEAPRPCRRILLSRFALAAVALTLLAAVTGGCGGTSTTTTTAVARTSSPTTPAAPAGPTKGQFIARADAICARTNAKLKPVQTELAALGRQSDSSVGRVNAARVERRSAAITREGIAQLQALPVPHGDASRVQKIIAALDDLAADIDNIAAATPGNETTAIEAAGQAARTTKATYQGLAQGYGFKVCGSSP